MEDILMESNSFDLMGYNTPLFIKLKNNITWAEKMFVFKKILFIFTDIILATTLFLYLDTKVVVIIMFIVTVFVNYGFLVLYRITGKDILKTGQEEQNIKKKGVLVRIMQHLSKIRWLFISILVCTESFVLMIEIGDKKNNYSIYSLKMFSLFIISTAISSLIANIIGKGISILLSIL